MYAFLHKFIQIISVQVSMDARKGIGGLGAGFIGSCECPICVLEIKLKFSTRAISAPNH